MFNSINRAIAKILISDSVDLDNLEIADKQAELISKYQNLNLEYFDDNGLFHLYSLKTLSHWHTIKENNINISQIPSNWHDYIFESSDNLSLEKEVLISITSQLTNRQNTNNNYSFSGSLEIRVTKMNHQLNQAIIDNIVKRIYLILLTADSEHSHTKNKICIEDFCNGIEFASLSFNNISGTMDEQVLSYNINNIEFIN